jgi:hypothetical protein
MGKQLFKGKGKPSFRNKRSIVAGADEQREKFQGIGGKELQAGRSGRPLEVWVRNMNKMENLWRLHGNEKKCLMVTFWIKA